MKNAQQLRKNACFVLKKYAISKIFWGLSTVGHEKYHQKLHHQGIQSSAPFFQRGGQEESMAWYVRKSWQLAPPDDHAAVCCQCLFQSQVDCFLHLSPFIFCLFQIKIKSGSKHHPIPIPAFGQLFRVSVCFPWSKTRS